MKKTKLTDEEQIKKALRVPMISAISIVAKYIGIDLHIQENNSGGVNMFDRETKKMIVQIYENTEHKAKDGIRYHFIYNDEEIAKFVDLLYIARYFTNRIGGKNLTLSDVVNLLIDNYRLEDSTFDDEINADKVSSADSEDDCPVYSLSEFLDLKIDPPGYLVNSLVPDIGVTMLHGAPGVGKSYLYNYFIQCMLRRKPVFGVYGTKPVNIIVINNDDAKQTVHDRVKSILSREDEGLYVWKKRFTLDKDAVTLAKQIRKYNIGLVIIDTLRQIHSGDENSSLAMSQAMALIKSITEPCNCAAIVVHHDSKDQRRNDLNAASGSIVTVGDTICTIHLKRRGNDSILLSQGRNKIAGYFAPIKLRFARGEENSDLFTIIDGPSSKSSPEQVSQIIQEFYQSNPNPGLKKDDAVKQLAEQSGESQNSLDKEFKKLIEEGFLTFDKGASRNTKFYYLAESQQTDQQPQSPTSLTSAS